MIEGLLKFSLKNRLAVFLFAAVLGAMGYYAYSGLTVEAFPDPTDTQVQLITLFPGQPTEEVERRVREVLRQHFRPEFLNRIDEVVVFHALDAKNIEAIAKIQLKGLEARLAKMEMKLDVSPEALAEIAKVGFDPVFGARPLKRAIQQRIENPVARLILEGRFGPKDVIPVDVEGGEFRFGRVVH